MTVFRGRNSDQIKLVAFFDYKGKSIDNVASERVPEQISGGNRC